MVSFAPKGTTLHQLRAQSGGDGVQISEPTYHGHGSRRRKQSSQVLSPSNLGVCYRSRTGTILTNTGKDTQGSLTPPPLLLPANISIEASGIVPLMWDSYHLHREQHSLPWGSLVQEWLGTLGTVTVTPAV